MPGGLGHVNVAVSMLFAGISGSSTADAAGCGKILIPAMVKEGYDTRFAIAITACSSVMGVIIPPSILMVVWGGVMQISCLLYTSPSPRDRQKSRMPSSA